MKIAMYEGYRKHPRRRRHMKGHHKHRRARRHLKGLSAKQKAARAKFKAAVNACRLVKGKAKGSCIRDYFKKH